MGGWSWERTMTLALMLASIGCVGPQAAPPALQVGASPGEASARTRIIAAIGSVPSSLNLMAEGGLTRTPGREALVGLATTGLGIVDHTGAIQPRLAIQVPTIENGLWKLAPDGAMEVTWNIRAEAQWHDGAPFTADDLRFTLQIGQDPEFGPSLGDALHAQIVDLLAPDSRTLVTTWRKPYIYANLAFSFFGDSPLLPMPRHLLERPFQEDRASFLSSPYWTSGFVGTGPYRLREWVTDSHAVFEANDRFVSGRPHIDEIEVRFVPDSNALVANILAGAIDLTIGRTLSLEQARSILGQTGAHKMDVALNGTLAAYPQFVNPTPSVLADVRFRRALLQAINREEMSEGLTGGYGPVAQTFIHPRESDYAEIEPAIVKYGFDPGSASREIQALGFARSSDGTLRDAAGEPLTVEIRSTASSEMTIKGNLAIAAYWKQIGIAAEPVTVPLQRANDAVYRATFPAFDTVSRGNYRPSLNRVLHSSEASLAENNYQGGNRGRYMNPVLDSLIERYGASIALGERSPVLNQIVHHVSDEVVVFWLFYTPDPTVYSDRLSNIHGKFERSSQVWNAHEWALRN
jgi:peptide/nickel transport system substrate-binding protein